LGRLAASHPQATAALTFDALEASVERESLARRVSTFLAGVVPGGVEDEEELASVQERAAHASHLVHSQPGLAQSTPAAADRPAARTKPPSVAVAVVVASPVFSVSLSAWKERDQVALVTDNAPLPLPFPSSAAYATHPRLTVSAPAPSAATRALKTSATTAPTRLAPFSRRQAPVVVRPDPPRERAPRTASATSATAAATGPAKKARAAGAGKGTGRAQESVAERMERQRLEKLAWEKRQREREEEARRFKEEERRREAEAEKARLRELRERLMRR